MMNLFATPKTNSKTAISKLQNMKYSQKTKRFTRKPGQTQKSQRSISKKSADSSVKQMYIKSPTSMKKQKSKELDFFATLAQSLLNTPGQNNQKQKQYSNSKERTPKNIKETALQRQSQTTGVKNKYRQRFTERNEQNIENPQQQTHMQKYNYREKYQYFSKKNTIEQSKQFSRLNRFSEQCSGYSQTTSSVPSKNYGNNRNAQQIQIDNSNINLHEQSMSQSMNYLSKIRTLQAQIQLKNHQLGVVSGQIQRFQSQLQDQKQKRKKVQNQKKQLTKQMKQINKLCQTMKMQVKKHEKQKQCLSKQIQFLQRVNYDENTRSLQSYRQTYLQNEIANLKRQLKMNKQQRQQQLQNQLRQAKQQKFNIQSHYKAMKVANQCLIKQLNHTQQNLHDIILNSQQYKKLRDKYVRFLQQYKVLRNQYWVLKAEYNNKERQIQRQKQKCNQNANDKQHNMQRCKSKNDTSSLFSITTSDLDGDLSFLKMSPSNINLNQSLNIDSIINNISTNMNSPITLLQQKQQKISQQTNNKANITIQPNKNKAKNSTVNPSQNGKGIVGQGTNGKIQPNLKNKQKERSKLPGSNKFDSFLFG